MTEAACKLPTREDIAWVQGRGKGLGGVNVFSSFRITNIDYSGVRHRYKYKYKYIALHTYSLVQKPRDEKVPNDVADS